MALKMSQHLTGFVDSQHMVSYYFPIHFQSFKSNNKGDKGQKHKICDPNFTHKGRPGDKSDQLS